MKRFFISVIVSMGCFMAHAQSVTIPTVNIIPGSEKSVDVTIANSTDYTAYQFDVALPTGVTLKSAAVKSKGESREITSGKVGDKYRVLSYAKDNNKLGEAEVLSLTFEAASSFAEDAQGNVEGIVLVDPEGNQPETVTGGTVDFKVTEGVKVNITAAKKALFCGDKSLDFGSVDGIKAYIVTGYDNAKGTIWLNQVKVVPANTAVLLEGEQGEYNIPVTTDGTCIYENMLVGSLTATTVNKDGGEGINNYILSNGDNGVGFYYAKESGSSIKAGGAYLPLPASIASVGTAGNTEEVSINKYGMVCYYSDQSLDFSGSDLQDVKAYTAYGYDKKGTILLTRVKKVPANTAVLLLAPAEAKKYIVPTASLQQVYSNMFIGSLTGKTVQKEEDGMINYYVSVVDDIVGLYLASENGTNIPAKRGWLPVPKEMTIFAAAATRGISSNGLSINLSDDVITMSLNGYGDDETTGISRVASEVGNDTWYNLKGQRIDTPTRKGLYIKNGKKVIVK